MACATTMVEAAAPKENNSILKNIKNKSNKKKKVYLQENALRINDTKYMLFLLHRFNINIEFADNVEYIVL